MVLERFHPAVVRWFQQGFDAPTPPQAQGWPAIAEGRHTLIAAPTGSGKTLAAFLAALDALVQQGVEGTLQDETQVVYVSPLKALSNDIEKNLRAPLQGIRAELRAGGHPDIELRAAVRTGDTPASQRSALIKRPPHILVTTPESLFLLLTSDGGRKMLRTVRTLIVDEIHALVRDKRGSHLALSVERLQALVQQPLTRVGLSATQKPLDEVARFLVGRAGPTGAGGERPTASASGECVVVDIGHQRDMRLGLELPASPLEAVMAGEVWEELYDRLATLVQAHTTTLIFVNTRRQAERISRHLGERLGEASVAAHHGSLSKEKRLNVEQRLKDGALRALVATASLELGIDIGDVDLVCQIGSPRSIGTFLQRVGRSGHFQGGTPQGRLFPLSRDELVECVALLAALQRGELDRVAMPEAPLDILAQQVVAATAVEEWDEQALFERLSGAYPFRTLSRERFDRVVTMLAEGFSTARGRRGALIHHDAVNGRLRARKGARLVALTSGGAIPDTADYDVVLEPTGTLIGSVHEDFAVESMAGDVFQLGNTALRVLRVETGRMRVEDAHGAAPTIPFWLGEAPARSVELSASVSRLRQELSEWLTQGVEQASRQLQRIPGVDEAAAGQLVDYLAAAKAALGVLPTDQAVVVERFFDEAGSTQLVIHAPFGARLNRAWGLALRKRFCRTFNFELQAAATDDAIVLSLGPTHSFPLEDVGGFLRSKTVRGVLVQAVLDAPMFETRWRWNASRALAVPRFRGGKKTPAFLLRMQAADLLAVAFPDAQACLENIPGDREIPDHPLVDQTLHDCLHEAMDIEGLERLLARIEAGEVTLQFRDLTEPSPLAHEILNARPYAFLDDAPLEERRTQAVRSRRFLNVEQAGALGKLDADAIARVREQAAPDYDSADELHDAMLLLGCLTPAELLPGRERWLDALRDSGRATCLRQGSVALWVAAERLPLVRALFPHAVLEPPIEAPDRSRSRHWSREEALVELLRSRLEASGPVTTAQLAQPLGLGSAEVDAALLRIEASGIVMRGHFTGAGDETEWCERRLLARIHQYTLDRLRREIEPVSAADLMCFLFRWHHVDPDHRMKGPGGVEAAIERLQGFEAASAAWEGELLPARVADYAPGWLDGLCLSGRVVWGRLTLPSGSLKGRSQRSRPVRSTPIALVARASFSALRDVALRGKGRAPELSSAAQQVLEELGERGASFFDDLVANTRLLRTQVEEALAELVAQGLVTADGFSGLRALLVPAERRTASLRERRRGQSTAFGMEGAGRWTLLPGAKLPQAADAPIAAEGSVETAARVLLDRYGVVFRKLLERESAPVWRELVQVYRRLEARGEIRGGRFVAGFSGEQFALPDAVQALRAVRRQRRSGQLITLSAADPLNLIGIVVPGPRVTAHPSSRVLFRDGEPLAVLEGGKVRFLADVEQAAQWNANLALLRRQVPPALRAYLSTSR